MKHNLTPSKGKTPYWIYALLILIIGVTVTEGILYLNYQNKTNGKFNKTQSQKTDNQKNPGINKTEIAKTALTWLDTQRNKDGIYYYSCEFGTGNCQTCQTTALSQREGAFMVYGRYKYYQKTKDINDLRKVKEELTQLSTLPLNFIDWNCRMLLDVWSDPNAPADVKSLVEKTCLNDGRNGDGGKGVLTQQVINKAIADLPLNINKLINSQSVLIDPSFDRQALKSNFTNYAYFASEDAAKNIVLRSQINANKYKPTDPLLNFYLAFYGYYLSSDVQFIYNNSVLGIAALDVYNATYQKLYLDLATYLYTQNMKLAENPNDYKDVVYEILFDQQLYKSTRDIRYKKQADSLIDHLINIAFDSPNYKNIKGACGAFVNAKSQFYSAKENGLIIGTILND